MRILIIFLFSICSCASASNFIAWPDYSCSTKDLNLVLSDLNFCTNPQTVKTIHFLGGEIPTLVLTDRNENILSLGKINAAKSIGNLHLKYKTNVLDFFKLLHKKDTSIKELDSILRAFYIDANNQIYGFEGSGIYAFAIVGENKNTDTVYIIVPEADYVYQFIGEFSLEQVKEFLASVKFDS
ncbi:hypothetical protein ACR30L_02030 [Psychromonas sp. PT13]|uniref:hypothetical protein n=1 Tax=Psychromonas sp. PT13 TaxID=3439547 RepID=UPI003EBB56C1